MNLAQIEDNVQTLVADIKSETFIYDLLLAYNTPKSTIKRLQADGGLNLSKNKNELLWKSKLMFRIIDTTEFYAAFEEIKANNTKLKHSPRFVIYTDFTTFLALDTKTSDTLDIRINDLAKHFDFFLPWAGMEKAQAKYENPADVKAAERMAKLYDEIKKDNRNVGPITTTKEEVHNLNVFLSRLLFCFFAEDTGIFETAQFTNAIKNHTQTDGSDLNTYLDTLFDVMNTSNENRRMDLPQYLNSFPYVNGGLFRNKHYAPTFNRKSREAVLASGDLQWAAINPDIFGSMIQAVITPEHRGGMGMHYTSVPNIMKVIEPLFLTELFEVFEAALASNSVADKTKKLKDLLKRIRNIKVFDPACGSGNFLIIAYKELRKLEMAIFKELDKLQGKLGSGTFDFGESSFSEISLKNFYGIELDDFAHEVATLSLWLAEHQMNQLFFQEFGRTRPALPLMETGNIVQGNATRIDWEKVCPSFEWDEIYILGNPPYLGSSMQSAEQKEDLALVFKGIKDFKNLDYIAAWFLKGASYIENKNGQFAFVSTNSICQGEQIALLWPHIFNRNLEICFAHTSFKWVNNAKANAAVIVVIVGVRNIGQKNKSLFKGEVSQKVTNINPFLTEGKNIILERRSKPISKIAPMVYGNKSTDDGQLFLTPEEKDTLLSTSPHLIKYIKRLVGSIELIRDIEKYCLWIEDKDVSDARENPFINQRLKNVELFRSKSDAESTRAFSQFPNRFKQITYSSSPSIIIPRVSSERREYIPFGFFDENTVVLDSAQAIYNPTPGTFSIINSKMHMVWVYATGGRLKTDIRYSSAICYNHFPFPSITEGQKQELQKHVFRILEEREAHSEKTLAQLYDPDKMPDGLREAHLQNDLAIERCYREKPFESDEERLEYLFKLYEKMIEEEKNKGTLFEGGKKGKKRKVKV
jgi:N-6 DNA Methylase